MEEPLRQQKRGNELLYRHKMHSQCGFSGTPSHKQLIPESERPFLEINFFLRFSVRLSGNNRSQVISMGDFGPIASNLCYDF